MSYGTILTLLTVPMVLALAFGLWAGLGYPGLYDRYESTGRAPRRTPFEMLVDWVVDRFGG
jgi:hypothetical protein